MFVKRRMGSWSSGEDGGSETSISRCCTIWYSRVWRFQASPSVGEVLSPYAVRWNATLCQHRVIRTIVSAKGGSILCPDVSISSYKESIRTGLLCWKSDSETGRYMQSWGRC